MEQLTPLGTTHNIYAHLLCPIYALLLCLIYDPFAQSYRVMTQQTSLYAIAMPSLILCDLLLPSSSSSQTALWKAAAQGHMDVLAYLIAQGMPPSLSPCIRTILQPAL